MTQRGSGHARLGSRWQVGQQDISARAITRTGAAAPISMNERCHVQATVACMARRHV
jgi:hypothetical protein